MNDEVKPFLVPQRCTIREAMEQLEKTEEKIIFVVDEKSRLVGSLTDGDIRRWILSDGNLTAEVHRICNRTPYVADEGYEPDKVRADMLARNLGCVPVVNSSREVVRLLFWKGLFQGPLGTKPKTQLSVPVVIMAGGRGTRLAPFTNILPKPLIPVGDRTIIEIIIDQFRPYGIARFHISINYKSKIIKSFFEELAPTYSVEYLEEKQPRGTAGGLRELFAANPDPIIVTNCDVVIDADYAELVEFHLANNNDITLVASLKDYHIPYGVCVLESSGNLANIIEKPKYSHLVNTGMYVIRRERLKLIPEDEVCDMPDLIARIKKAGGRVGVFPISETAWIDTGEWTEYRKALESLNKLGTRGVSHLE